MNEYSDLTIKCGDREFHVHKVVVCAASPVLKAACQHNKIERRPEVIEHTEYDADTVERMISYMYTQTYKVEGFDVSSDKHSDADGDELTHLGDDVERGAKVVQEIQKPNIDVNSALIAHIRVFGIADFYEIPALKVLATELFMDTAENGWQTDGFINVIQEVNSRTSASDRGMRDALRDIAIERIDELVKNDDFVNGLAERKHVQEFSADMFRESFRQYELSLQGKDEMIKGLFKTINLSSTCMESVQPEVKAFGEQHLEELEQVAKAITNLVDSIEKLPLECPNVRCNQKFGRLNLERKGPGWFGAETDGWVIKCRTCSCRLLE